MRKVFHAPGFAELREQSSRNRRMSLTSEDGSRTAARWTRLIRARLSCKEWGMKYPTCGRAGKPADSLSASGYKAGFQDCGAIAGRSQTQCFVVWPYLAAATRGRRPDRKPVFFGKDRCFGSFNLGSEGRQSDHRGAKEREGCQAEKGFKHLGGC